MESRTFRLVLVLVVLLVGGGRFAGGHSRGLCWKEVRVWKASE